MFTSLVFMIVHYFLSGLIRLNAEITVYICIMASVVACKCAAVFIHSLYWHFVLCFQEAHPVSEPWREVSQEHECCFYFINIFQQDCLCCFDQVLRVASFMFLQWVWWVGTRGGNVVSVCWSLCWWEGSFFLLLRCGWVCFSHVSFPLFVLICLCSGPRRNCVCVRRISRPSQWRWSWRDTTVSRPSPFHSLHLKPGTPAAQ